MQRGAKATCTLKAGDGWETKGIKDGNVLGDKASLLAVDLPPPRSVVALPLPPPPPPLPVLRCRIRSSRESFLDETVFVREVRRGDTATLAATAVAPAPVPPPPPPSSSSSSSLLTLPSEDARWNAVLLLLLLRVGVTAVLLRNRFLFCNATSTLLSELSAAPPESPPPGPSSSEELSITLRFFGIFQAKYFFAPPKTKLVSTLHLYLTFL